MSNVAEEIDRLVDSGELMDTRYSGEPYPVEGWAEVIGEVLDYWNKDKPAPTLALPGLGLLSMVEGQTGGEGSGSDIWVVLKLVLDSGEELLFRKTGYYQSFVGSEWDGQLREVEAREVTVTQYFDK